MGVRKRAVYKSSRVDESLYINIYKYIVLSGGMAFFFAVDVRIRDTDTHGCT